MIFGATALDEAEGAILAHSIQVAKIRFKKGRRLSRSDLDALKQAGIETVTAARLEPGDVHEDQAAASLATAIMGDGLSASTAHTGRCNLIVQQSGLLLIDQERLKQLNCVDESLTLATLAPFEVVQPRRMAATIKIIPFAVPSDQLERCLEIARANGPIIRVQAFEAKTVGLVQSTLPGLKETLLDKTRQAVDQRLRALGSPDALERRCAHDGDAIAEAAEDLIKEGAEVVLLSGASAIVDRRDVVPSAIERIGGSIDHFGMPVDPGNLLLLGRRGAIPMIGLPGCARSPKLNGFDWILERLLANVDVLPEDIMGMGAGGLLKEIPLRPLPRAEAVEAPAEAPTQPTKIAAVVMAAGRSTRMGAQNKLLAEIDGKAMVRRAAETALASQADPVILVTGHEHAAVETAVEGLPLHIVHNPDYRTGLSSSLRAALAALPEESGGVLICLADMPRIDAAVLDRLIEAFDPLEGRAICLPTWRGKRGNPVLFARHFVPEMAEVSGDVGARAVISDYPEAVHEVAMDDDAVLRDIDTPEALKDLNQSE